VGAGSPRDVVSAPTWGARSLLMATAIVPLGRAVPLPTRT
jgi:hypothetical protein